MAHKQTGSWIQIARQPEFHRLLAAKRKFIVPGVVFFLLFYMALPITVGYWPNLMKTRVVGPINRADVFALAQFVMTWALAWVYLRAANRFDRMAQEVVEQVDQ
jgi:uncharacterized membrane protein (DUF485 family)